MIDVTLRDGAAVFAVRVSPGAARSKILGEHDGALKVSVSAPPEKGKANKAVIELVAGTLGVRKSDVTVISGDTSRDKRVAVSGLSAADARKILAASAAKA